MKWIALMACAMLAGCSVGPRTTLTTAKTGGIGSTVEFNDPAGVFSAGDTTGKAAQMVIVDENGLNKGGTTEGRTSGFVIPMLNESGEPAVFDRIVTDGEGNVLYTTKHPIYMRFFIDDQGDTSVGLVKIPFGPGVVAEIHNYSGDKSAVVTAYNQQVLEVVKGQVEISESQLEAVKASLDAGKDIVSALAEVGVRLIAPTP